MKRTMERDDFADRTFSASANPVLTSRILEHADPRRPLRVLDIGCGIGGQLFELAEVLPQARLVGVDISPANIQQAEREAARHPAADRLRFAVGDYLTFTSQPYDLILSDSTLQNIDAPNEALLAKLAADATPGGYLLVTLPHGGLYNHGLWTLRRLFRAVRGPRTDRLVLAVARRLHGRDFQEELLRERLPYMYMLPQRYDGPALRAALGDSGWHLVAAHGLAQVSLAQPRHRLLIFRKQTS